MQVSNRASFRDLLNYNRAAMHRSRRRGAAAVRGGFGPRRRFGSRDDQDSLHTPSSCIADLGIAGGSFVGSGDRGRRGSQRHADAVAATDAARDAMASAASCMAAPHQSYSGTLESESEWEAANPHHDSGAISTEFMRGERLASIASCMSRMGGGASLHSRRYLHDSDSKMHGRFHDRRFRDGTFHEATEA